jgi:hypothetical protein
VRVHNDQLKADYERLHATFEEQRHRAKAMKDEFEVDICSANFSLFYVMRAPLIAACIHDAGLNESDQRTPASECGTRFTLHCQRSDAF